MSTFSYLAYSQPGRCAELAKELSSWPECSVYPSDNADLLILVTEASQDENENLKERLQDLTSLSCLTMVFGHDGLEEEEGQ